MRVVLALMVVMVFIMVFTMVFISLPSLVKKENYEKKNDDFDFVEHIIFINLDDRKDRLEHMNKMLSFIDKSKITRMSAVKDSFGHIGCSKSHIKCLNLAIKNNWKNILILEDDMMWNNYNKSLKVLKKIYKLHPDFDVITFGNSYPHFNKRTYRLYSAVSTTAYLVNNHYYETLRDTFEEGLKKLEDSRDVSGCLDQIWKKLQKKDKWYIVNPALVVETNDNYSSIENKQVNNRSNFNV